MDDLQNISLTRPDLENNDGNESDSDTQPSRPILTPLRLPEMILGLEEFLYECNVQ